MRKYTGVRIFSREERRYFYFDFLNSGFKYWGRANFVTVARGGGGHYFFGGENTRGVLSENENMRERTLIIIILLLLKGVLSIIGEY